MVEKTDPNTLRVNPDALKKFAQNLGNEAKGIKELNIGDGFSIAVNALPGTEFGSAAQQATDAVNHSLTRIGERLEKVADTTHAAANVFEVTESDFTDKLKTIGLQLP